MFKPTGSEIKYLLITRNCQYEKKYIDYITHYKGDIGLGAVVILIINLFIYKSLQVLLRIIVLLNLTHVG